MAGEYIHARGTANGKRVQANLGAKNHAVIMPDADKDSTIDALLNASMGAAGQRCMALSVAVLVGESAKWVPEIVPQSPRHSRQSESERRQTHHRGRALKGSLATSLFSFLLRRGGLLNSLKRPIARGGCRWARAATPPRTSGP